MAKKSVNGKQILYYILAVIFIALAVIFALELGEDVFGFDFRKIAAGVALIVVGYLLLLNQYNRKNKTEQAIAVTELVVLTVGSLLGFILPGFNVKGINLGSITQWVAIMMIIHATIYLSMAHFSKLKLKNIPFYFYLAMAVVGGYLFQSNLLDKYITVFIVAVFIVLALLSLHRALVSKKNGGKKKDNGNN